MFMPVMGFVAGLLVFGVLGAVLLKVLPQFRLRPFTLAAFVAAALPSALAAGYVYGQLFASSSGQLTTRTSVVALFLTLAVGGSLGGLAGSRVACRLTRR